MLRLRTSLLLGLVVCATVPFLAVAHAPQAQEEAGYVLTISSGAAVDFELSVAVRGERSEVLFFRETAPFSLDLDSSITVLATVRASSPGELRMRLTRKIDGLSLAEFSGRAGVVAENVLRTGHRFTMDLSADSE